jgi:hypothetical protein
MEKKNKTVAAKTQTTEKNGAQTKKTVIPMFKPARVGNFKLWRSKLSYGKGKEKVDIEQINISNLDGTWQVRIPATFEMFSMIKYLFAERTDDTIADKSMSTLHTFFSNMLYASVVDNGFFQQAINLCAMVYANPSLLKEDDKNHEGLMNEVKSLVSQFLAWRAEYEKRMEANAPSEEEMKQAEVAGEMRDELERMESNQDPSETAEGTASDDGNRTEK